MDLVDRGILTPLNDDVDSLNNDCMRIFPGEVSPAAAASALLSPPPCCCCRPRPAAF